MSSSYRSTSPLPWHHRLEARVLLAVTLIAGVALLAMLAATRRIVTQYSLTRSADDLVSARDAFRRHVERRMQAATRETRLVTELPTFQSLISSTDAARDTPTVNQLADDYCRKLTADFCIVTDGTGEWLGRTRDDVTAFQTALSRRIMAAAHGQEGNDVLTLGRHLFLVVSEPASFGTSEVLGTFTAAYALDDTSAAEFAAVTHADLGFLCDGRELCGTSLATRYREPLEALIHSDRDAPRRLEAHPRLQQIGDKSYVAGIYRLDAGASIVQDETNSSPRLVLLQDWAQAEHAISQIDTALLWVGLTTFGIALAGGLVFSRRMTRALRDLANVADEVASGNWTRQVPIDGPAEAQTMAVAFNRMTVTLSHWHREAKNQSEQVQEAYERFRSVTDSANDAIVSVNRLGEIVFWNLRAEAVFGYTGQEALGQSLTMIVPERYRSDYSDELTRIAAGESRWIGSTVELAFLKRDGTEIPVELSLSTWKSGQEIFYTTVIRDISERKQAAEALRQREEQLRQAQKMEAVGRLAGGIAHDFNNLLTAILGYAALLIEDLPADASHRRDVEEIQKAGRSAATLIRDLLAFSRKQVLQPVVLDVNAIVADTENLLRRLIGEHIELVLQLEPHVGCVRADRGQLEQVLINLAVNARDAMADGGRLEIKTSTADLAGIVTEQGQPAGSGRYVVLSVTDTGEGMSAETRARIFEPFFTTKAVGKGTGLGLATVYGIVRQSEGHIWVDSELGRGATFNIALPYVGARATEERDRRAESRIAPGSEVVLLVEDNDSVRSLARETLARSGYAVLEARNGEEALEVAAAQLQNISLLVTDVVMPVMGGRELAAQLANWRPELKIIFTSGYVDDAVTRHGLSKFEATFLQKPFTPAAFGRVVRDVLDGRSVVRQSVRSPSVQNNNTLPN